MLFYEVPARLSMKCRKNNKTAASHDRFSVILRRPYAYHQPFSEPIMIPLTKYF